MYQLRNVCWWVNSLCFIKVHVDSSCTLKSVMGLMCSYKKRLSFKWKSAQWCRMCWCGSQHQLPKVVCNIDFHEDIHNVYSVCRRDMVSKIMLAVCIHNVILWNNCKCNINVGNCAFVVYALRSCRLASCERALVRV